MRKSLTNNPGLNFPFHAMEILQERWEGLLLLIETATMLKHQQNLHHLGFDTGEQDTVSTHTHSVGCLGDISPKLIWKTQYKPMARCIKPQDDHYAEAHFLLSTAGQLIL